MSCPLGDGCSMLPIRWKVRRTRQQLYVDPDRPFPISVFAQASAIFRIFNTPLTVHFFRSASAPVEIFKFAGDLRIPRCKAPEKFGCQIRPGRWGVSVFHNDAG